MQNLLEQLKNVLAKDERLVDESGELLKNKIIELSIKLDKGLIKLLLADKQMKEVFFTQVDKATIFDKDKFIRFISNKQFLPDSYTAFKNKVGLTEDDEYIREKKDVVLSWPYKDCVLEGGQTKEDAKRDEIFWNETLAPDEITRLFEPKVFTNSKRIDAKGEKQLKEFKADDNGNIKDNLIIKGNNLLALHSLKERFAGQVKLIYIDPPYNTGNDSFGYNDRFNHSSWLTFMKNRLNVAWELLKDGGLIFISIDDHEVHRLRLMLEEIFGEENYLNTFCWINNLKGRQISGAGAAKTYEYVLAFAKRAEKVGIFKIPVTDAKQLMPSAYKGFKYEIEKDEKGEFIVKNELHNTNSAFNEETRPYLVFNIHYNFETKEVRFSGTDEDKKFQGFIKIPPKKNNDRKHRYHAWRWSKDKIKKDFSDLKFVKTKSGAKIFTKIRDFELTTLKDVITNISTTTGTRDFNSLFEGEKNFTFPKPVELLKIFINQMGNDEIALDFFAGSGTLAQAILETNNEKKKNRRFIIVEQLDYVEDITKERIAKTIRRFRSENFVYIELAKWNKNFVEQIKKAKTSKELQKLWEILKEKARLSYKVNIVAFEKKAKDFANLSFENQKRFLLETLDQNHLYINCSEIDDKDYGVSEGDKKLNREFYGK